MMLEELLENSKKGKKIISIFSNQEETDKFCVGKIMQVCENYCIIALISPSGMYDGYRLLLKEDIYKIESEGKYENKIETLYKKKKQTHKFVELINDNALISMLNFIKSNNYILTIQLFESGENDIQGFVSEIGEKELLIKKIDEYGKEDGISVITIENITSIVCDSEEEVALKILSEVKK